MRVLMLCPDLLAPPVSGGRIRMYQFAQHLGRKVTLDLFAPDLPEPESLEATRRLCRKLWLYPPASREGPWARRTRQLRSLLTANTYPWCPEVMERLHRAPDGEPDDLLHLATPDLSRYARPYLRSLPAVIDFFGTTLGAWREFRYAKSPGRLLSRGVRYLAALAGERDCARTYGSLIAISEQDRDYLHSLAPEARIYVVPNGIDLDYFAPRPDIPVEVARLAFVGDMGFPPNVDAMLFFHRSILPRLRPLVPDLEVWIVGRDPAPAIRRLVTEGPYHVTGFVEDTRPFLAPATAAIVPMRLGAGVRNKVLEALAMGKAVVSTRAGAEGIEVIPGEHLLLADSPQDFVAAILRILREPTFRNRLEKAARARMEERYTWTLSTRLLDEAYLDLARKRGRP
ncbi:MAG: glycosyltransferase [candidate division NC10 bacterium]|nr:glycosyltransferase [candidate division NC10 bacterium]